MMLLLAILLLVGGAAILRVGLVGRRVGRHPHCRRCGFDLYGAPVGTHRCGECGADIFEPRAVVTGRHERRARPLYGGAAMLGAAALAGALVASGANRQWRRMAPTWYALREAAGVVPFDRAAAIDLLVMRDDDGALGREAQDRLDALTVAAAHEGRSARRLRWGDRLIDRLAAGAMTDANRAALLASLARPLSLTVRPFLRAGDAPAVRWAYDGEAGVWLDRPLSLRVDAAGQAVAVDGGPLTPVVGGPTFEVRTFVYRDVAGPGRADALAGLAPGAHEIEWRYVATLRDPAAGDRVLAEVPLAAHARVTVLPPGQQDVPRFVRPELRAAMEAWFGVESLHLPKTRAEPPHVHLAADGPLPADVGFDVFVLRDGVERRAGTLSMRAGRQVMRYHNLDLSQADLPAGGRVSLILRTSEAAARATVDVTQVWDGDLRFDDIAVEDLAK